MNRESRSTRTNNPVDEEGDFYMKMQQPEIL
jgi:hypothetical protein